MMMNPTGKSSPATAVGIPCANAKKAMLVAKASKPPPYMPRTKMSPTPRSAFEAPVAIIVWTITAGST